jgi:peptidoglycan/LPS O-acetylase OafA/YrhL
LRCVAIVAVLLHHYPRAPDQFAIRAIGHYGWAGVDLFFVLSGYLIAGQFFAAMVRGAPITLASFYYRRAIRILPNYLVVLGGHLLLCVAYGLPIPNLWRFLTFTQNFGVPAFFITSWSLCVEQHFYLAFPPVMVLIARFRNAWVGVALFCLTVTAGIALRHSIWSELRPDLIQNADRAWEVYFANVNFPTYTRLDGIACGVAIAAVERFRPRIWVRLMGIGNWLLIPAGALLLFAALALRTQMGFYYSVLAFPIFGVAFGLLVASAVAPNGLLGRVRIPGVETLAVWSYAIYLTHGFALNTTVALCDRLGIPKYGLSMAVLAITNIALFGAALFYGVERFFLRLRDRKAARSSATGLVA